ncbi:MAG: tRNA (adenine(22)-N(1))-methyltransferase [Saccharofermentanales bacterium]
MTKRNLVTKLDRRLQYIINAVGYCRRVIDIGTDHALLPLALAYQNKCEEIIAIDISSAACDRARKSILRAGAGNSIRLINSEGLKAVTVKATDIIVLAGLGGKEIISILSDALPLPGGVKLIIQAQSDLVLVRKFLQANNWMFLAEDVVEAKSYPYVIISVLTETVEYKLSDIEVALGPLLTYRWQSREPTAAERMLLERELRYRAKMFQPSAVDREITAYIHRLLAHRYAL